MGVPVRAAFFDFGNTLVEGPRGQDLWRASVLERIEHTFGIRPWAEAVYRADLGTEPSEPYRQQTNRRLADWMREHGEPLSDRDVERLRVAFAAPLPVAFGLAAGVVNALRWCRAHGLAIVVLTNATSRGDDDVRRDCERLGLGSLVDHVVSSYSTGWLKPHAAPYERACITGRGDTSGGVHGGR